MNQRRRGAGRCRKIEPSPRRACSRGGSRDDVPTTVAPTLDDRTSKMPIFQALSRKSGRFATGFEEGVARASSAPDSRLRTDSIADSITENYVSRPGRRKWAAKDSGGNDAIRQTTRGVQPGRGVQRHRGNGSGGAHRARRVRERAVRIEWCLLDSSGRRHLHVHRHGRGHVHGAGGCGAGVGERYRRRRRCGR